MKKGNKALLWGDLDNFGEHCNGCISGFKNQQICRYCGEGCFIKCGICNIPLYFFTHQGKHAGKIGFIKYHYENHFRLALDDFKLTPSRLKKDWQPPTTTEIKENREIIWKIKSIVIEQEKM